MICKFENCEKEVYVAECCKDHFIQIRNENTSKRSNIQLHLRKQNKLCSIPKCEYIAFARGLCHTHYYKFSEYQDPLAISKTESENKLKEIYDNLELLMNHSMIKDEISTHLKIMLNTLDLILKK